MNPQNIIPEIHIH